MKARRAAAKAGEDFERRLLIPGLSRVFEELSIGASLWQDGRWPELLHEQPSVSQFEQQYGAMTERHAYNDRCFAEARRTRKTVEGEHTGFSDFFVPIVTSRKAVAFLVVGPFLRSKPTGSEIMERWHALTRRQGHPGDPEFSRYAAVTLDTLVVEDVRFTAFRRWLECLTALFAGTASPAKVRAEVESFATELRRARLPERVWQTAAAMIAEPTSRVWSSPYSLSQLQALEVQEPPEFAAVCLFTNHKPQFDPVDDLVLRHHFQRACAELAYAAKNALSGRIGRDGVTFLVSASSPARARRKLLELGEKAASVARKKFGLRLHFGLGSESVGIPEQYPAAFAAAEAAATKGVFLTEQGKVQPSTSPGGRSLATERRELLQLAVTRPSELAVRFDRFLEAVAARSGYRHEVVRGHAEATIEGLLDALKEAGALDARSETKLSADIARRIVEATSLSELLGVCRSAARDMTLAAERPSLSRHERSLNRAEEYLKQHYAKRLDLAKIAKVAGFAPNYLSTLFHQKRKMTLENYLTELRLERAKELLAATSLNLQRVAELSGFSNRNYFGFVFKTRLGETPQVYRRRTLKRFGQRAGRSISNPWDFSAQNKAKPQTD